MWSVRFGGSVEIDYKDGMRRKAITENQVIIADSNISLDNIYKAIGYLTPEHQANILVNYKLIELYDIFANNEGYEEYINNLFNVSNEYMKRAIALSALHTEAFMQSRKKDGKFDPAATMCEMFECMTEADQKRFCEGMFQKKGFFEDAYKNIMDVFQNVMKSDKENNIVGGDENIEGDKYVEISQ